MNATELKQCLDTLESLNCATGIRWQIRVGGRTSYLAVSDASPCVVIRLEGVRKDGWFASVDVGAQKVVAITDTDPIVAVKQARMLGAKWFASVATFLSSSPSADVDAGRLL